MDPAGLRPEQRRHDPGAQEPLPFRVLGVVYITVAERTPEFGGHQVLSKRPESVDDMELEQGILFCFCLHYADAIQEQCKADSTERSAIRTSHLLQVFLRAHEAESPTIDIGPFLQSFHGLYVCAGGRTAKKSQHGYKF